MKTKKRNPKPQHKKKNPQQKISPDTKQNGLKVLSLYFFSQYYLLFILHKS